MSGNQATTVVVIGGGHSGLAMSRCLTDRGIDHVVLERGRIANSWHTQRWDSFTLLTPNFQTRLPGASYDGDDPDGFADAGGVIDFIEDYATAIDAPVHEETSVSRVHPTEGGYRVETDQGPWSCRAVVLACGAATVSAPPPCAEAIPDDVIQVNPLAYRNPGELPDGGVLVVGGAATGIQLAEEIHASGRPVTLSIGEHVRMPRRYRGQDIQYWMEAIGRLDERYDEVEEIRKARKMASPQLVGTPERRTLDLNALTDAGVELRGRLGTVRDGTALFSGGLGNHCALGDQKLGRLLDDIDEWIVAHDDGAASGPPERLEPTRVPTSPPLMLDLARGGIRSVLWATGFRPDLSFLDLDVFDERGQLRHDGGVVTDAPGICFLGATFLRRRKSSFIHGAGDDAADLADHLADLLAG